MFSVDKLLAAPVQLKEAEREEMMIYSSHDDDTEKELLVINQILEPPPVTEQQHRASLKSQASPECNSREIVHLLILLSCILTTTEYLVFSGA